MNFVNSMAFTAITFVGFTALVALISWWKTRGDNLETQDGYYLGGRSLTGPVIAGSLLMTNLSAEQLVGNNGQAVRVGMSTMGWEVTSAIALVILAFVLMPKYLKTGLTTVPQFFEQRYDEGTRRLVSLIVLLSYVVIMLPNILYAGAQVFVNIFGIDEMFGISRFAAIAIVCVATAIVGSIYAIFGGLKAIALSDSINGLGLIVGGLLVPVFGFMFLSGQLGGDGSFMDGFDKFLHTDPSYLNAINEVNTPEPWLPWPLLFTGLLVNNMYYWATNQSIIQRTFGAKNLKEAQKGAVFAGFLAHFNGAGGGVGACTGDHRHTTVHILDAPLDALQVLVNIQGRTFAGGAADYDGVVGLFQPFGHVQAQIFVQKMGNTPLQLHRAVSAATGNEPIGTAVFLVFHPVGEQHRHVHALCQLIVKMNPVGGSVVRQEQHSFHTVVTSQCQSPKSICMI